MKPLAIRSSANGARFRYIGHSVKWRDSSAAAHQSYCHNRLTVSTVIQSPKTANVDDEPSPSI